MIWRAAMNKGFIPQSTSLSKWSSFLQECATNSLLENGSKIRLVCFKSWYSSLQENSISFSDWRGEETQEADFLEIYMKTIEFEEISSIAVEARQFYEDKAVVCVEDSDSHSLTEPRIQPMEVEKKPSSPPPPPPPKYSFHHPIFINSNVPDFIQQIPLKTSKDFSLCSPVWRTYIHPRELLSEFLPYKACRGKEPELKELSLTVLTSNEASYLPSKLGEVSKEDSQFVEALLDVLKQSDLVLLVSFGYMNNARASIALESNNWRIIRQSEMKLDDEIDFTLPSVFDNEKKAKDFSECAFMYSLWRKKDCDFGISLANTMSWQTLWECFPIFSTAYLKDEDLPHRFAPTIHILKCLQEALDFGSNILVCLVGNTQQLLHIVTDCISLRIPFMAFVSDPEHIIQFVEYLGLWIKNDCDPKERLAPTFGRSVKNFNEKIPSPQCIKVYKDEILSWNEQEQFRNENLVEQCPSLSRIFQYDLPAFLLYEEEEKELSKKRKR